MGTIMRIRSGALIEEVYRMSTLYLMEYTVGTSSGGRGCGGIYGNL